jgi:hypothetical protein
MDTPDRDLIAEHPWAAFLPTHDRQVFKAQLAQALAASTQDSAEVQQLLREWRASAEIHADPELAAALQRPIVVGA